MEFVAN